MPELLRRGIGWRISPATTEKIEKSGAKRPRTPPCYPRTTIRRGSGSGAEPREEKLIMKKRTDGPKKLIMAILGAPKPNGLPRGRVKTKREAQVIRLIALGDTNQKIADRLGISIKTVEKHRENAMRKFKLRNTADITRFAVASKIIEVKPL